MQISQMGNIKADPSSLRSLGMTAKGKKPTAKKACRGYQTGPLADPSTTLRTYSARGTDKTGMNYRHKKRGAKAPLEGY